MATPPHHPPAEALQAWLAGSADSGIDHHLSTCQRCATALEQLDSSSGLADGLKTRLEARAAGRPQAFELIGVVADLVAAGFETTRLLLTKETDDSN